MKNYAASHSLGIFDSGVGGLTVMQRVMERVPNERIVYFGDTARVPYGHKSQETIQRYSIENATFLMDKNIKMLIVACNTASAMALPKLQQIFTIPVVGVIEPGAAKAASVTKTGRIGVLGTKGTIQSGAYQKEITKVRPDATIFAASCPMLVPLVEERLMAHPATRLFIREYLQELMTQNVDTILLGCTHYPLLYEMIQDEAGKQVTIVDSADTCADTVLTLLNKHDMQAEPAMPRPKHEFYVSDDPERFQMIGKDFFGHSIPRVELKRA